MSSNPGFPNVPPLHSNEKEHRKQLADALNRINSGKFNATIDLTLNANQTTTTLTDPRIFSTSAVIPAMATTANAATAIKNGIWISGAVKGSCTVNHASSANTDQTIRFVIVG
jgi:hypothetical protein